MRGAFGWEGVNSVTAVTLNLLLLFEQSGPSSGLEIKTSNVGGAWRDIFCLLNTLPLEQQCRVARVSSQGCVRKPQQIQKRVAVRLPRPLLVQGALRLGELPPRQHKGITSFSCLLTAAWRSILWTVDGPRFP